jgi:hypothetical protein
METKVINHARATMPSVLFNKEYLCLFADDALGFFKQKDIRNATARKTLNPFWPMVRGHGSKHYVMGVDPARARDRFAITIVELGDPSRVVYCWTSEKKTYSHSTAKVRELIRRFNIVGIAMDEGGGGYAVEELLNNKEIMKDGDFKIYRYDDDSASADSGRKILYMFNFSSHVWLDEANNLLQKNIEDKVIMFPVSSTGEYSDEDLNEGDDATYEINEMKRELTAIETGYTRTGRRTFNLAPPDPTKDVDGVIRHKDRYSALLLSNYLVSRIQQLSFDEKTAVREKFAKVSTYGGWVENFSEPNFSEISRHIVQR